MIVERDRRDWDELADLDPLWAALTTAGDHAWNPSRFIASGEDEIARLLAHAQTLGYPARRERALDFGCGPGRLTRALARHFRLSVGVDVSSRMVQVAQELNADIENCRFLVSDETLEQLNDQEFDLVYSNLVLQHVSDPAAVLGYIRAFARVLAPCGLLVFQLLTAIPVLRRLQPRRRLYHALRRAGVPADVLFRRMKLDPIGLYAIDRTTIEVTEEKEELRHRSVLDRSYMGRSNERTGTRAWRTSWGSVAPWDIPASDLSVRFRRDLPLQMSVPPAQLRGAEWGWSPFIQ